ncbi:Sulfotransferase domain [Arabidopsis thaliana x Arabidopsis arenosa]|uniref:Sulfotransferase n=1 Tax=Arabidopsis thaliana x Arabidopsis arenosa TaxID=1240361 RepID=A0A8T1YAW6_9BRAS|nr:Sulfotransferase domain [Arabidopsis thaliana x Arabidopsis arenosa]
MNQSELLRNFGDDEDIRPEVRSLISSLPSYTDVEGKKLCNYQGCWYYYKNLQAVLDYQKNFKPLDTDIIVTSYPKSGTTWLKALTVALLQRSEDGLQNHPLTSDSPHGLVPFLEMKLYLKSSTPDLTKLSSSPRLFSTHMPFNTLSRIENKEAERSKLESIVESFCKGVNSYGPFWDNVLSYWKGSLEDPDHAVSEHHPLSYRRTSRPCNLVFLKLRSPFQAEGLRPVMVSRTMGGFTINIIDTHGLVEAGYVNHQALEIIKGLLPNGEVWIPNLVKQKLISNKPEESNSCKQEDGRWILL